MYECTLQLVHYLLALVYRFETVGSFDTVGRLGQLPRYASRASVRLTELRWQLQKALLGHSGMCSKAVLSALCRLGCGLTTCRERA